MISMIGDATKTVRLMQPARSQGRAVINVATLI